MFCSYFSYKPQTLVHSSTRQARGPRERYSASSLAFSLPTTTVPPALCHLLTLPPAPKPVLLLGNQQGFLPSQTPVHLAGHTRPRQHKGTPPATYTIAPAVVLLGWEGLPLVAADPPVALPGSRLVSSSLPGGGLGQRPALVPALLPAAAVGHSWAAEARFPHKDKNPVNSRDSGWANRSAVSRACRGRGRAGDRGLPQPIVSSRTVMPKQVPCAEASRKLSSCGEEGGGGEA